MKKGFTLIELLAVIVILAIIALIASPIIIGLIDDARKETFKSLAYGIIRAGEMFYHQDMMSETNEEVVFTYREGEESNIDERKLEYNGRKPNSGTVIVNKNGEVALAIHNGSYCAEKGYSNSEITLSDKTEEDCVLVVLPGGKLCGQEIVDSRDSNVYKTVKIEARCWMAENLKYIADKKDIGDIEKDCTKKDWNSGDNNACYIIKEGDTGTSTYTGAIGEVLYQWKAAMNGSDKYYSQGLCPDGWRVSTDAEWTTLIDFVGEKPGDKLKSKTPSWCNDTDESICGASNFNGKPAGYLDSSGTLRNVSFQGRWWTSSIFYSYALKMGLSYDYSGVESSISEWHFGYSVRCILEYPV